MKVILSTATVLLMCAVGLLVSATDEKVAKGRYERIKVHGKTLEGNLEGDSLDRDVFVYLPPSYAKERNRRYPVVYFLAHFRNLRRRPHESCEGAI